MKRNLIVPIIILSIIFTCNSKIYSHFSTDENSLPNCKINAFLQTKDRFIWIASNEGLYKFDGNALIPYQSIPWQKQGLKSNNILNLTESSDGKIWISTLGHIICVLNPDNNLFEYYEIGENVNTFINDVKEDKNGNMWIASSDGLYVYYIPEKIILKVSDYIKEIPDRTINIIEICPNGNIFINDRSSLLRFQPDYLANTSESFLKSISEPDVLDALKSDQPIIFSFCDGNEILYGNYDFVACNENTYTELMNHITEWVLANNYQMNEISKDDENFYVGTTKGLLTFTIEEKNNPPSITFEDYDIISIFFDTDHTLWAGSTTNGFIKQATGFRGFNIIYYDDLNEKEKLGNIRCILKNRKQTELWIGLQAGGLAVVDLETRKVRYFTTANGLLNDQVRTINESWDGNIWIGTLRGVQMYDIETKTFKTIHGSSTEQTKALHCYMIKQYIHDQEHVWYTINEQFIRYTVKTGEKEIFDLNEITGLNPYYIRCFIADGDSAFWIGTDRSGLINLNIRNRKFRVYPHSAGNPESLSDPRVFCLEKDNYGQVWIGTNNGLNCLDTKNDIITHYFTKDGISGNSIYSIYNDKEGHVWLCCNKGITEIDVLTKQANILFGDYYFLENACSNPLYREILAASRNCIIEITPEEYNKNTSHILPKPQLTALYISDEEILPEKHGLSPNQIIDKQIYLTNEIKLSYKQNNLSFKFSPMDFNLPEKYYYRYILDGYDSEWRHTNSTNTTISYTHIPSGKYRLLLQLSDNNKQWTEPEMLLSVVITPPFWNTVWFFSLIVLVLLSVIYFIIQYRTRNIRKQNELLEESVKRKTKQLSDQNEELEKQKLEIMEMNEVKLRFFSNISHELRTPLTMILSPLESLRKEYTSDKHLKSYLELIHKSAKRLYVLIDQLLEIRKVEEDHLELEIDEVNVCTYINSFIEPFNFFASQKNIGIELNYFDENLVLYFDPDKMTKILSNLLMNAIKYTEEKGTIKLHVIENNDTVEVIVQDNGKGIDKNILDNIFKRYYRDTDSTMGDMGYGIGLAFCKNLVECHKGIISVESEKGKGTKFTILFHKGKDHLKEYKFSENNTKERFDPRKYITIPEYSSKEKTIIQYGEFENKPNVMVVEDNEDMRRFVSGELIKHYNIFEARNGKEALEIISNKEINMIISDIMMPEMNGYELCKLIKENINTSHIPVMLITAKNDDVSKTEGYELGADSYITKPFNIDVLVTRINNLLKNRQFLKSNVQHSLDNHISENKIGKLDKAFLNKLVVMIEEQMQDPNFSIENLSSELGMSRTTLYRKIKSLTDSTPNEFVRTLRLKRAAKLISEGSANVSEACDMVGFQNISYFRTAFKAQFGITPSDLK